MAEYAKGMNREIYNDENKLPDKASKKLLEEQTEEAFIYFLKEKGISIYGSDLKLPLQEEVSQEESEDTLDEGIVEESSTDSSREAVPNVKKEEFVAVKARILEERGRSYRIILDREDGVSDELFVPKGMLKDQSGIYNMPLDFYESKVKELEEKRLVSVKASILESKEKSHLIDLELESGKKWSVYVPKSQLKEQEDGSYKMPMKLYEQKVEEVLYKELHWIYVEGEVLEEKEKSYKVNLELDSGLCHQVYIAKTSLKQEADGSYRMPIDLYDTKVKEIEERDKKLVRIKAKIIDKKEKSVKLRVSLSKDLKTEFYVPKSMLKDQKDGSYKIPETYYQEKVKEILSEKYSKEKQSIYQELAQKKGFDVSKRALRGDDLLWYGKVEQTRTYRWNDKSVKYNQELEKKISNEKSEKERRRLSDQLLKDKDTGAVIKEGVSKGGSQYHVHVMVSRHDKTMKDVNNKISMSPLANARDSKMAQQGAQVGFNRDIFYQKCESLFDTKFDYERKEYSYEHYKQRKDHLRSLRGEGKRFLNKHTGVNKIKQELMPFQKIKDQLGVANIPTSFPTSITKAAVKVVRKIIDKGLEY